MHILCRAISLYSSRLPLFGACSTLEWTLRHWQRTSAVQCWYYQPAVDKMISIFIMSQHGSVQVSQIFISYKVQVWKSVPVKLHHTLMDPLHLWAPLYRHCSRSGLANFCVQSKLSGPALTQMTCCEYMLPVSIRPRSHSWKTAQALSKHFDTLSLRQNHLLYKICRRR